jgi:thymidylate synthase
MLKTNPNDRRMIVTAWNPSVLGEIALPSCHMFFMFSTMGGKLNCHMTQRSADLPLGVPFNITCYAALTQMIAQEVGLEVGEFSHYLNDLHIYENQIEGALKQLKREPRSLPTLKINKKPFWDISFEDFTLEDYNPHPPIKFPVAI